ncbi:MAG: DnaB-like helicase C-terminal domain-containing protein, partial [Patescibacteria group bacterium]
IGKTAWALNVARHVAVEEKLPICVFSLEMSREELVDRLLIRQADIDAWKMKTGRLDDKDLSRLSEAMGILAEAPFFIDDTPALSILEMRTKARRLQVEHGLKLIVVDYLQLMRSHRRWDNRVQEVSEISQGLKNLARELKVPVLALSQLSRAVEARGGARPRLADLRESGCLTADTKLMRADTGALVEISKLVGEKDVPLLVLDEWKLKPIKVKKVFPSGKKQTYRLVLKSGREIKASANHPFLSLQGWLRLDQLKIGGRIAVPREMKVQGKKKVSDDRLIVLAHLIGDGCYLKRQPLHYTNSDMGLIKILEKSAQKEFKIKPRLVKQESWYHLYLASEEKLARGRRNPIVKWFDEELGIFNQRSGEKVLPELVFKLNLDQISLFIKHLWATDGCVFVNSKTTGPKVRLYYASKSRTLIDQLQHLLLRLGIITRVGFSKKKGYQPTWSLHVQGKENQELFLNKVGVIGKKAKIVAKAIKVLSKIEANPNNDVIPKEVWLEIEEQRKKLGWTTREFHRKMNWAYSGTQRHGNGVGRKRLAQIAKIIDSERLAQLAKSDVYWDEIKKIEKLGIEEVFDIEVPRHHNFVANDIIVHNSIEQDADVVAFLYREDEDNREVVTCEVSKHRNGPVDSFQMYFNPKRISFFGVKK